MYRNQRICLWLSLALNLAPSTAAAEQGVLFSYFLDNGNAGVYLAYSADGREFKPLNNGSPVFTPPQWPNNQVLTRDPSILYHGGLYHVTWTSDWIGRVFGYSSSPDLVTWSTPRQVTPFSTSLPALDQPNNVWAPEVHFDPIQNNYQIVFSSTTPRELNDGDGSESDDYGNGINDHRLYSVRTNDFNTFTPAVQMFDHGYSIIDGQLTFDNRDTPATADDRWIMAIKNEKAVWEGGKNISFTYNNPDQSAAWTTATAPFLGPGSPIRPAEHVEGPSMIRFNGEWLLYADAYASGHYSMISSTNLSAWSDQTAQLSFPHTHPRHGTALVVDLDTIGWRLGYRIDLNDDGEIDWRDWVVFRSFHLTDLSAMTPEERGLAGDLDGDGDNDFRDFRIFQSDYVNQFGFTAFARMIAAPEPSALVLAALAVMAIALSCRRR